MNMDWKLISDKYPRPRVGWLKCVRSALCMTQEQLGYRAGTSRENIARTEKAEIDDTIKLSTLRKYADALGCELVYAFVPRKK